MTRMMGSNSRTEENSDTDSNDTPIVGREKERAVLLETVADPGRNYLHVYGPRGSGKSLLASHAMDTIADDTTCYIHCTRHNTQYKVLKNTYETITGDSIGDGYHTSKLHHELEDILHSTGSVIVLDELDFLLQNDGADLIYYLTRIANDTLSLITVSANHPDLSTVIEERVYSSLQPNYLNIESYSKSETLRILSHRLRHSHLRYSIDHDALSVIAEKTSNIRLALHWVAEALSGAEDTVTADIAHNIRQNTLYRYWDTMLTEFTHHHHLLIEALLHRSRQQRYVNTGWVYEHYNRFCHILDIEPLTSRRLGDFLKHLELLGVVQADYQYGGVAGKTRNLRLQKL